MKNKLDKTDYKILRLLQQNGRISFTELAELINLSISSCTERVKRLEREKYILSYHAKLNAQKIGYNLLVFVEINLDYKSDDIFEKFKHAIQFIPEIMECHLVSGDFDYLLKARIAKMDDYRTLLGNILLKLPNVRDSKSYIVMEELRESSNIHL